MQAQNYVAPSALIAAAQARAGSYGPDTDVIDHVLYDSLQFQATTVRAQSVFFAVPNNGGTKVQQETNMSLQGMLPSKQSFVAEEISLALLAGIVGTDVDQNTVLQACFNIIQYSTFNLKLAGREFDSQFPGSCFLPGFVANSLASAANGSRFGDVVTSGWIKLKIPVTIEPTANFNVLQTTGSSIAAVNTILNTASDVLTTQNAQLQIRMKGILLRAK